MKRLFIPFSLVTVIYTVICGYFYSIQTASIFPARVIANAHKYSFSLPHEELFIDTADGEQLNAVLFRTATPKGVVLHFHGNAENMLNMETVAMPFVQRNYDFLAFDYRSYGKSTGELSEDSLFSDARLMMQWLQDNDWQQQEILLYGSSIGTGIAIQLASTTQPKGVILYSPYSSMADLVKEKFPFLPVDTILKFPLQSEKYLPKVQSPVIILHGEQDQLIPFHHAQALAEINGELVPIARGGHNNLTSFAEFWAAIDRFLKSVEVAQR